MNFTRLKLVIMKEGYSLQYSLLIKENIRGVHTHLESGRRYFKSFNRRWLIDMSPKNKFKEVKDIIK